MSASNSRNASCVTGDDFDWRLHVGFLSHDNVPHFWNAKQGCWASTIESSPTEIAKAETPEPTGEAS